MNLDFDEYLDWLLDKPLQLQLSVLELWTEHTPLALWLRHKLGVVNANLLQEKFLLGSEWVKLPVWARINEALSQELLVYKEPVTVRQALWIADLVKRELIAMQTKSEKEVKHGV